MVEILDAVAASVGELGARGFLFPSECHHLMSTLWLLGTWDHLTPLAECGKCYVILLLSLPKTEYSLVNPHFSYHDSTAGPK